MAVQSRHFENIAGPLNILDLRHFTARDLRPLLEAEAREWDAQLQWDYSGSAEMILRYADSRILPGYAVLDDGRVSGYAFFVYEGNKAVVGDVYALPHPVLPPATLQLRLLDHVLETLQQTPGITRIEAQLLLHESPELATPFLTRDFAQFRRLFMTTSVETTGVFGAIKSIPGMKVRRWTEQDFQPAAALITKAYAGHVDSKINDQYRSAAGSMRFLNNIVRFPGCGNFDPSSSFVVIDEARNVMAGLLLCSRVRKDVAHITQVCLLPEYRRRGLGKLLIAVCADELSTRDMKSLTLTVSEENTSAVALYEQLGFSTERLFDAFVWER